MAIYNSAAVRVQLTVRLLNTSGGQVGSTVLPLRANGRITFFGSRLAGAGSDFRGTLAVMSSAPVAAMSVRQNAASPAYTLLPATDRQSLSLRSFLPHFEDRHSDSGMMQTNFCAPTSPPRLPHCDSHSRDDGTPFLAGSSDGGTNEAFEATIPPGATIFW